MYFDDDAQTYMVRVDDGTLVRVPLREIPGQVMSTRPSPDSQRGREAIDPITADGIRGLAFSALGFLCLEIRHLDVVDRIRSDLRT